MVQLVLTCISYQKGTEIKDFKKFFRTPKNLLKEYSK